MLRIVDYKIVSEYDHGLVNYEVVKLIAEGYQPKGYLTVLKTDEGVFFSQVMVKYQDKVKVNKDETEQE
ncbi:TPA: hypothetical protein ACH6AG_001219 [Campylobacter jejuni]